MKPFLTFFTMCLCFLAAHGQNWECLQNGVKHYFINSNGYLRGIRIDSVRATGDSTIYYPFHTPRGPYKANPVLDSTGSSWLGKTVVNRNGTFIFDNLWHDSLVINSQASVGDSWVMFQDTTSLYYDATVTAQDTMTVLGSVDSIKRILVTAHNTGGIVTADPLDSIEIILSKNNGFVQVCDLYTFPYHKADSIYRLGLDYYLDASAQSLTGYGIRHSTVLFSLVPLANPTGSQLYNWNTGDAYEYKVCNILYPGDCIYPYQYYYDSITNKTTFPDHVQYNVVGWLATQHFPPFSYTPNTNYPYDTVHRSFSLNYYNDLTIDTTIMPEEMHQPYLLYYMPGDTTYCMGSAKYQFIQNAITGNLWQNITFESSGIQRTYKTGLGLTHYYLYTIGGPSYETEDTTLLYYHRSGSTCGTYVFPPLAASVKNISLPGNFSVYPNPASDALIITVAVHGNYTLSLINTVGQAVKTISFHGPEATLPVNDMQQGLYILSIANDKGERANTEVTVMH